MPYVDEETYQELMSVKEHIDRHGRKLELVEAMYKRIERQMQEIIQRYGSIPNPLISSQVVEDLRILGRHRLGVVYGKPSKNQAKEMWGQFREHFEIKRITQLSVSQIPDAIKFIQRWAPIKWVDMN